MTAGATAVTPDAVPEMALSLPPAFEAAVRPGGDAFRLALAAAAGGAGAGHLVWAPGPDRLDVAVVLEPDTDLRRAARAVLTVQLAMADALAAVGPPQKPVAVSWPDGLSIDGARVGGVRLGAPPDCRADAVPAWLVAGVVLRARLAGDPGRHPERTALREEGFGDVDPADLVEAFARHLLFWMDRWQDEGFAALARHWLAKHDGGAAAGLDPETGDLLMDGQGAGRQALADALAAASDEAEDA